MARVGVEDEQHAAMAGHGLAVHQAAHARFLVGGHFGLDAVHAGSQLQARQLLRKSQPRRHAEQQA